MLYKIYEIKKPTRSKTTYESEVTDMKGERDKIKDVNKY